MSDVFRRVAESYDRMNDAMSFGVHRLWKNEFVRTLGPTHGSRVLDLAGGTGDVSFRMLDAMKASKEAAFALYGITSVAPSEVILSDINPAMLGVGKERAAQQGYLESLDPKITIMEVNAQEIPLPDDSVDAVTMAFGIRNCTDIDAVLREGYRVLRHGGRFLCLEFSQVPHAGLRELYDLYSFHAIPAMGQAIAGDRDSYQYLVESIRKFPDQETFAAMFRDASFSQVSYTNLSFGVAAIHSGWKFVGK